MSLILLGENNVGHSCDLKGEHQFFFKHQCKVCSLIIVLSGRIIMVTKECHLPYDRPILSKVSVQLTILLSNFFRRPPKYECSKLGKV